MARGRGRGRGSMGRGGKSAVRSNNDVTANVPTVPTPAIVTSQANVIGGQNNTNQVQPLIPQIRSTVQTSGDGNNHTTPKSSPNALNHINRTREGTSTLRNQIDMTRGRGTGRGSIGRAGKSASRTNMPVRTANMPTIPTPTVAPQTSGGVGALTSNYGSTSPTTPYQTNPTTIGTSSQTNQKHLYWDSSITDAAVKKHWQNPKCAKKSKINAQNRRGGKEVIAGTHTGGSISIGEYRKRLAAKMGRDPTPSELHLHVYTHGHDGKSFVDERSRIIHKRFEEILREKTLSESVIDQIEAYYQAAEGEKKRRVFGLGSEAKGYYGQTLCISCGTTSSSASHESVPAADSDLDEFVKRLIPALKNQFFPIVIEEVQKLVSSRSVVTPPATPLDDLDSLNDDCNDLDQL
ncbi:hypothetical protein P3S67_030303 [Capsicum chacoense]